MIILDAMKDKEFFAGKFSTYNYKERMEEEVSRLLSLMDTNGSPPSIEARKSIIVALTDAYIEQTGKLPEGNQVQRLGNWLLLEYLTDNHPDKVTREDYPFLTKRQLRTRYRRERADENIPETLTAQKYLGGKKQSSFLKSE